MSNTSNIKGRKGLAFIARFCFFCACSILAIITIFREQSVTFYRARIFPAYASAVGWIHVLNLSSSFQKEVTSSHSMSSDQDMVTWMFRAGRKQEAFDLLNKLIELELAQKQISPDHLQELYITLINLDREGKLSKEEWIQLCKPADDKLKHLMANYQSCKADSNLAKAFKNQKIEPIVRRFCMGYRSHGANDQIIDMLKLCLNSISKQSGTHSSMYQSYLYDLALAYHENKMDKESHRELTDLKAICEQSCKTNEATQKTELKLSEFHLSQCNGLLNVLSCTKTNKLGRFN